MTLIQVIVGTTREQRFSGRVAPWLVDQLGRRDDLEVELVDLRDHPLPFFDGRSPIHTLRDYPTPETRRLGETLDRADGFVILTAEYNHGYSAVLKNAIDHTWVEWNHKPVTFVGWGNTGGARAVEQLRLVMVEMEAAPLRHAVHILPDVLVPAIRAPEPFDPTLLDPLAGRVARMADDLVWWADALAVARARDAAAGG